MTTDRQNQRGTVPTGFAQGVIAGVVIQQPTTAAVLRERIASAIESCPALLTTGNEQQDRFRALELADAVLGALREKP